MANSINASDSIQQYIQVYSKLNIPILTCCPNKKTPNISWKSDGSSYLNLITDSDNKCINNLAIFTGRYSNITAVDVDEKDNGMITFTNLIKEMNLSLSDITPLIQTTPNGGLHLFFKYNPDIKSRNKLTINSKTIGIDIISDNKYLMIEPSTLLIESQKKEYKLNVLINDLPNVIQSLPTIPDWLVEFLNLTSKINKELTSLYEEASSFFIRITTENTPITHIIPYLDNIDIKYWDMYDSWRNLMFAIGRVFIDEEQAYEIGIKYSKLSKKYDEEKVIKLIDKAKLDLDNGCGMSTIINYSNISDSDNHTKIYNELNEQHQYIYTNRFIIEYSIDNLEKKYGNHTFESKQDIINKLLVYTPHCIIFNHKTQEFISHIKNLEYNVLKNPPRLIFEFVDKVGKKGTTKTVSFKDLIKIKPKLIRRVHDVTYDIKNIDNSLFDLSYKIISSPINECNINHLLEFIREIICQNEKDKFIYLMEWIKSIILYNKNITAILLYSKEHGVGKNVFINFITTYLLGKKLSYISSSLENIFEKHIDLSNKIFCVVNELSAPKTHYISLLENLKSLITDDTITVNKKFQHQYQTNNYTNWIFTTNNNDCLYLSQYDRRFNCFEININNDFIKQSSLNINGTNQSYFTNLIQTINTREMANSFQHYLHTNTFNVDISKPLETEFRNSLRLQCTIELFYLDLINGQITLADNKDSSLITIHAAELYTHYELYCRNNLLKSVTNTKFGRDIKRLPNIKHKYVSAGTMYEIKITPNKSNNDDALP